MKFLKTKFKISKKLIIKKLTPSFYLKKHIKKSGSNNRRKMIPEHSLSKITPAHKRKKPEKIEYKKKIGDWKTMLSFLVSLKKKHNNIAIIKNIKSWMSLHPEFFKKFILLRSDLRHRRQKRFSSNITPRLKIKNFKQIVFMRSIAQTYKILTRKNKHLCINFFKKKIFLKNKFLKKQINFFKTNKKTNKKTIFEKSSFFKLKANLKIHVLPIKLKPIIFRKTKKKKNWIKAYKNFEKKNIKFKESKALITQTMSSLKNSYDYL